MFWPESRMRMSTVGFEHVFKLAVRISLDGLDLTVSSLPVLALLKIAAFSDRPERKKDLADFRWLLERYEAENDDRLYSDPVLDAQIEFDAAPAFLLGLDLGTICTSSDAQLVRTFLEAIGEEGHAWIALLGPVLLDRERQEQDLRKKLDAFKQGFQTAGSQ